MIAEWTATALDDWRRLSLEDAERVAVAVQRWLDANEGFDLFAATLAARYCNFRKTSIYAGSNEIQRNIIAKMSLGLQ